MRSSDGAIRVRGAGHRGCVMDRLAGGLQFPRLLRSRSDSYSPRPGPALPCPQMEAQIGVYRIGQGRSALATSAQTLAPRCIRLERQFSSHHGNGHFPHNLETPPTQLVGGVVVRMPIGIPWAVVEVDNVDGTDPSLNERYVVIGYRGETQRGSKVAIIAQLSCNTPDMLNHLRNV